MENFAKFRNWLLVAALTGVLSLAGYVWSNHVSAEAAALTKVDAAIVAAAIRDIKHDEELKLLRELSIRMEVYIEHQKELNEWFVTEHQRASRRGN